MTSTLLPALAQHSGHGHSHHGNAHGHAAHGTASPQPSPYASMQTRSIKALSQEQMEGLRSAKGLGMAMAAELNGYPGPLHVLELAPKLELSEAQLEKTRQLYADMQTQAKAAGEKVIDAERALDALFAYKKATADAVMDATAKAAAAQGVLRATHLRYHLSMMEVLSTEQVARYNTLRGY